MAWTILIFRHIKSGRGNQVPVLDRESLGSRAARVASQRIAAPQAVVTSTFSMPILASIAKRFEKLKDGSDLQILGTWRTDSSCAEL